MEPSPKYITKHKRDYHDYLRSPAWRDKRERVLRRDGYMCQSCLSNPATQVHHMTYKYGRFTPLFLLQSVCDHCHDEITAIDNGELKPWNWDIADEPNPATQAVVVQEGRDAH